MICAFRPYEGDEDYIFISYSHEDKERVFPILEMLNNEGFRIWYDGGIEWGSEWPASIEDHLIKAAVYMFFYSKAFILSKYCKQELSLAAKYDKKTLPVILEEVKEKCEDKDEKQSSGFEILLSLYQAANAFQYSDREKFVEQLGVTPMLQPCKRLHNDVKSCTILESSKSNEIISSKNFDKIIESGLVRNTTESCELHDSSPAGSTLERKLYKIKVNDYLKGQQINKQILDYEVQLLNPRSFTSNYGRHFSIVDRAGKNTLIFEVIECFDYSTMSAYVKTEQVVRLSEELEDGCYKRTYYLECKPDGNPIIIYTYDALKNEIYINTGMLIHDEVKITTKPFIFSNSNISPNNKLQQINGSTHRLVKLSDKENYMQKEKEQKETWYEAEMDASVPIVMDIDKSQAVRREIYFDENENKWKAKIKLETSKSYFVFWVNYKGENSSIRAMTPLELGRCYKNGQYGFPKDEIKAVKYLEEDDSADALYEIAHIFMDDSIFQDYESAQTYLHEASKQGSELANIELALNLYFKDDYDLQLCIDVLRRTIKENSHNVMFTLAYILETNNKKKDLKEAFDIYYSLAKEKNHCPAQFRLCRDWDDSVTTEEYLYHSFQKSAQNDEGVADFCLGSVLLYGDWDFPAIPKMAFYLLEQAANRKNFDAQYELFELYHEKNGKFENQHKAYHWCCSLNQFDSSILVDLSNWLLDGAGGHNQEEADKQAFSILQHASLLNNRTAINDLGWMYKSGRGCEQNYEKAKELFEQAAGLGSTAAITHLGELYQHGLGVMVDVEQAIQYYKQAADLGYEKALKKLDKLNKASEYQITCNNC